MDSFKLYKQSKPAQLSFLEWLLEQESPEPGSPGDSFPYDYESPEEAAAKKSPEEAAAKKAPEQVYAFMKANPTRPAEPESDFLTFVHAFHIMDDLKKFKTSGGRQMFTFYKQGTTWSTGRWNLVGPSGDLDLVFINKLIELTGIVGLKNIIDGKAANGALIPVIGRPEEIDPTQKTDTHASLRDPTQSDGTKSPVDTVLANMEKEVERAKKKTKGKAKEILNSVDKYLEQLASSVDEEAGSEFIKDFLNFASKFYDYSFNNQMLIYMQMKRRGKNATRIAKESVWLKKFGRSVKNHKEALTIIVPFHYTSKKDKDKDDDDEEKDRRPLYFGTGNVFDISSTEIVKNANGDPVYPDRIKTFEPNDWQLETNETWKELENLIESGLDFIKSEGIKVRWEKMSDQQGGYAREGKEIGINNTYGGTREFSTLIHELAHSILHFEDGVNPMTGLSAEGRAKQKREEPGALEFDAESSAYVVLQHFKIPSPDSARYLALWQGTGEKIRKRRTYIHKASKEIIEGIHKFMELKDKESEKEEKPVTV